jgi:hypothetical protein
MTEAEWLSATDTTSMLEFLRGKVSDRKLRLYLCGGIHRIAHLLYDPASIEALGIAERFADGMADNEDMRRANWIAEAPTFGFLFRADFWEQNPDCKMEVLPQLVKMGALSGSALTGGEWHVNGTIRRRLLAAAELVYILTYTSYDEGALNRAAVEMSEIEWPGRWLCNCVFGNPFLPVTLNPSWLTSTVLTLASGIYNEKAFDRMPILAHALQDAGCDNNEILNHCRQPGEHVRGCFVVDLVRSVD